jgi:capsular polysaccharide biosynthesis protein
MSMSMQEFMRLVRRRGWIVVAAVLLTALAAYGVSMIQEQEYRATVNVSTVPARADFGLGATAKDLLRNFAENIKTPENAQRAIERAQLDMNRYDFLGNLQVVPDSSTFTIKVEARNPDPEVAKLMALTMADGFVEERTQYYAQQDKRDRIEVKIRSRAIGADQIQPKPLLNAVAGAVLGLLIGVALLFALAWMEADLLRTPASVERAVGLPVLGAVPAATATREPSPALAPATGVGSPKPA